MQLPLSLLKAARNHPMVSKTRLASFLNNCMTIFPLLQLVELKNGETYNGHLVNCDNWMNIQLREVICTSRVSWRICLGRNPLPKSRRSIKHMLRYTVQLEATKTFLPHVSLHCKNCKFLDANFKFLSTYLEMVCIYVTRSTDRRTYIE